MAITECSINFNLHLKDISKTFMDNLWYKKMCTNFINYWRSLEGSWENGMKSFLGAKRQKSMHYFFTIHTLLKHFVYPLILKFTILKLSVKLKCDPEKKKKNLGKSRIYQFVEDIPNSK